MKKLPTFLYFLLFASFSIFAQHQKGLNIKGDSAYNRLGWSVSMSDAHTLAVGAPFNAGNKPNAGNVKVYRWKDTTWVQKGATIQGGSEGDASGRSISMPDSNTIAIGAHRNTTDSVQAGRVRVHKWNGTNWVQKGGDLLGESSNDNFGYSVSMPDSNYISIGAIDNDDNGSNAGHVRNYRWNGVDWIQIGLAIEGDTAGDKSGWSVSAPDTLTVAIGSPFNYRSYTFNTVYRGLIRIYERTGTVWTQKGLSIVGASPGDYFGWSVHMPDKNTVAIQSLNKVNIYSWNGSAWIQKGQKINAAFQFTTEFSYSNPISMPNSNTIAVGEPIKSSIREGQVKVYKWNNNTWAQKGADLIGDADFDKFGYAVSMPDTMNIAIGAPANSDNGTEAGQAKVYWFCNTSDTISKVVCNPLTSPSGKYTWTVSGTYIDTIKNANRCDSIITFHLTVGDSIPITIKPSTCYSYTSPSGNYTWNTSGTYMDTLAGVAGCDTIINIELDIFSNSTSNVTANSCDAYTSPSGKYTWTTSGTYQDTIPNSTNCDSIITIQLRIDSVDASITKSMSLPLLTANTSGATYQWIYCDSNYIPVPGETRQEFSPSKNGNYAAIVSQNGCTDTSSCEGIFNVGIYEYYLQQIKIFPNPSREAFTIDLGESRLMATIQIYNIAGKLIKELSNVTSKEIKVDLADQTNGVYLVHILIGDQQKKVKLIKQE
ncbi:MAG: T9SS type A sorting domain-containing protein [Vicingaceae bacterium]